MLRCAASWGIDVSTLVKQIVATQRSVRTASFLFLPEDNGTIFGTSPGVFPCSGAKGGVDCPSRRGTWWRGIGREPCVHDDTKHRQ